MDSLRSQRGALSLESLIFLLVIGAGIYVGIKMAVPWIRFYQVQELLGDQVVRLKVASEEEVREAINKRLDELKVSLSHDGLKMIREEGKPAVIEATYKVDVVFIGGYKYTYTFQPQGVAPR